MLELFICKTEIKIVLRGGCSLSTSGNGFLAIFHTKKVEKNWHICALLESLAPLSTFLFTNHG
jgi:hypothetical protein